MEIIKVDDYRKFAENLKKKTDCDVSIKIMGKNHFHYQLETDGISLGILCLDKGEASFAPFVTFEQAKDDQYINVQYMPLFDDFTKVLSVFKEMFVVEEVV
ncbi:hypothetical protein [Clostridium sp. HBUAS56010]|uniref:hypothetical protein n=1 Tax=Clostridium sp. HBUAS56010 TaxID=2571127 RepID=UPI001178B2BE|nr:hypothetical protein [Clostridium sp. HBUAS56010]